MMKKMILMFALMLMPLQSFAASAWVEINLTGLRTGIDADNHYLYFDPIAADADPNNCGLLDQASYPMTNDWKIIHSMVLAALLADKTLIVKFTGCNGSSPEISMVEIRK